MTIQTRYNLGGTLWAMHDNRPVSFAVATITIYATEHDTEIYYTSERGTRFIEGDCHPDRDTLQAAVFPALKDVDK